MSSSITLHSSEDAASDSNAENILPTPPFSPCPYWPPENCYTVLSSSADIPKVNPTEKISISLEQFFDNPSASVPDKNANSTRKPRSSKKKILSDMHKLIAKGAVPLGKYQEKNNHDEGKLSDEAKDCISYSDDPPRFSVATHFFPRDVRHHEGSCTRAVEKIFTEKAVNRYRALEREKRLRLGKVFNIKRNLSRQKKIYDQLFFFLGIRNSDLEKISGFKIPKFLKLQAHDIEIEFNSPLQNIEYPVVKINYWRTVSLTQTEDLGYGSGDAVDLNSPPLQSIQPFGSLSPESSLSSGSWKYVRLCSSPVLSILSSKTDFTITKSMYEEKVNLPDQVTDLDILVIGIENEEFLPLP